MGLISRYGHSECVVRAWVEEQVEEDRKTARQIGAYLQGQENLVEAVLADEGCHLWSVAEWLCNESINIVARDRDRAGEYAEAALAVAEVAPGEERFRMRLGGVCWAHIGNVHRVRTGFKAADIAVRKSTELLDAGVGGDPHCLLDIGRVLGMEASLRRDQGKFAEALTLLQQALPLATREIQAYLRLNYGFVLEQMGDYLGAMRVLEETAEQAPHDLMFYARFNIGVNLGHLGRHEEAEDLLPEIYQLAVESESEDNQRRTRWLHARVDAGLGRTDEALGRFKKVRSEFLDDGNTYDASRVGLELAKIYLERGETATVKQLAKEMAPVFVDAGVHRHAQEALRLFREAAEREAISVELVVRIITYLQRARNAPGLRFEATA